ncbi:MAG TPA: signal peptide peptidase SppA [Rhizomicrobium sp.]|jgi:protease-4
MVAFLQWAKAIALGTLNGFAKLALALLLIFIVFVIIGEVEGDGLPNNMVLSLDLRQSMSDSAPANPFGFGEAPVTVMNTVLALDQAERDNRVKGVFLRVGSDVNVAQAEEIDAALKKFKKSGKFVIAYASGFESSGLGDYLAASAANEIWMQPKSVFGASGEGGGSFFLRGLFDKIQAQPQIAKRAEYKSAADQYMEKNMTPADKEQTQAMLQSWYDNAATGAATDRRLPKAALLAAFQASPQFAEDAKKARLVDKLGYDDDAQNTALERAGDKAKIIRMSQYIHALDDAGESGSGGAHIALIEAAGDIVDGTAGGDGVFNQQTEIAGDDMAQAIRQATADTSVKAILLRVDSPGGSVSASDQILDAVKKAQAKGKPVVVSMATLAASGGYYISLAANRIVAEPGTITGSIGVLTGKISFGKSAGLLGVGVDELGVGKNALMNSAVEPYTDEQWANLNHQADVIYADFTQKVAAGRKLPLARVQEIARGRVWTGADALSRGLVDELGGFWSAVADAKKLGGLAPDSDIEFLRFPRQKGFFEALNAAFGGATASMKAMQGLATVMNTPPVKAVVGVLNETPKGGVELRAPDLPFRP